LQIYRRLFSYIPQDPILFRGSLRENLDLNQEISDEKLIEILNLVEMQNWASVQGLGQVIEEKGSNVSVGEKQLICLARALIHEAPVVIMDEATSSVDPQSEEILVRTTDRVFQGRTQIIIAHRLSTLRKCDRVLWLDQGQIKRLGPTDEVLKEFSASDRSETEVHS
jgi:ABC-type multidrug transport system fused ATPase/permease subunit